MPLTGEYEPSTLDWARKNAEEIMASGGTQGMQMRGMAVILLTTIGAKTGKIRKTPLMRVEHDGEYAIVASLGGAPKNPVWYYNVKAHPRVELRRRRVRPHDAPHGQAPQGRSRPLAAHGARRVGPARVSPRARSPDTQARYCR